MDITKAKLTEIWQFYPLLHSELESEKMSTDYIVLTFKNGSTFSILSLSASARGQRATGGKRSIMPPFLITKEVKKMVKLSDKQRWAIAC